jgi:hypothetical protein
MYFSRALIRLDHLDWGLHPLAPNRPYGKVTIFGDYSPPVFSNIGWTVKVYDHPSIDKNGHLTCSTTDPVVDSDSLAQLPIPPGPEATSLIILGEVLIGDAGSGGAISFLKRGPICQALDTIGVASDQLLIPGGNKIDVQYARLVNSGNDLIAGGSWAQVSRAPSIGQMSVNPHPIKVAPEKTKFGASFSATLRDLRPPLTITWTNRLFWSGAWSSWKAVSGSTQTTALGTATASMSKLVSWPRPKANVTPGTVQARVQITDADNLSASKTGEANVQKVGSTGLPPVCDNKPSLPQCNP